MSKVTLQELGLGADDLTAIGKLSESGMTPDQIANNIKEVNGFVNTDNPNIKLSYGKTSKALTKAFDAATHTIAIKIGGIHDIAIDGTMKVTIKEGGTNHVREVLISGHWDGYSATKQWTVGSVKEITSQPTPLEIKFAKDATSIYVILGAIEARGTLKVAISDVMTNFIDANPMTMEIVSLANLTGLTVDLTKSDKLVGINSSASEIDGSVNKKQIVLPKALISKGKDVVKFNTLTGVIFQPPEKSSVYSIGNIPFFDGDSYIELKETVSAISSIILPCDFSLLGSNFISIYVWADDWYNFSNITLELSTNGGSNFYDKLSTLLKTKTTVLPNHWNNIRIPISDFALAGSATYQSNIKSIRLSTNNASGKIPNIKFGGLKLDVIPRTAIAFSFDDGMYSDYTVVMPKLNSYGFKFTTFIISSLIGTSFGGSRLTLAQLQEILENGNYIGVHGTSLTTNWVSTATLVQAESHIKDCLKYIIDNGLSNDGMHYAAYPMGEYNDDIIALLKKYNFKGARTTDSKIQNSPVEDLFKLKLGFELYPTLQENIDALESRLLKGGLINLYQHEISASSVTGPISPEVFNGFVDYIHQHYKHLVTSIPEWVNEYETGAYIQ